MAPSSPPTHKLPGAVHGAEGLEALRPEGSRETCGGADRQCHSSGVHKSPGRRTLGPAIGNSQEPPAVVSQSSAVPQGRPHPRDTKPGGRPNVEGGTLSQRVEIESHYRSEAVEQVRRSGGGPVRLMRKHTVRSVVFLELTGQPTPGRGRFLPLSLAQNPPLRFPPGPSDPSPPGTYPGGRPVGHPGGTGAHERILVPDAGPAAGGSPLAIAVARGRPVTAGRRDSPPPGDNPATVGLAAERERLQRLGLPPAVVRTIQSARAPSTTACYAARWSAFQRWCTERESDPISCPLPVVLTYLQTLVDNDLAPSTVKAYAAAISSCHDGYGERTVFAHPLVKRFLKGVRRQKPAVRSLTPQWDLTLVLRALGKPPFEPLAQAPLRLLSLKTALLLALTSAKRVSDLCALSVSPSCLSIRGDRSAATLQPTPSFTPKNFNTFLSVEGFFPPGFFPPAS